MNEIINFILLTFTVYALLQIIRSNIVDFLFMGQFLNWLQNRGHLLFYELTNCDICLGFWLTLFLCAFLHHSLLILPIYGALCWLLGMTNCGKR